MSKVILYLGGRKVRYYLKVFIDKVREPKISWLSNVLRPSGQIKVASNSLTISRREIFACIFTLN